MTYTPEKIAAYAQLDEAVENLRKVYAKEDPEGQGENVLTGYVLLTSAIEFSQPEPGDPYRDDLDTRSVSGWYSRRGQDPTLSYGIVCEAVRHYNEVQVDDDED